MKNVPFPPSFHDASASHSACTFQLHPVLATSFGGKRASRPKGLAVKGGKQGVDAGPSGEIKLEGEIALEKTPRIFPSPAAPPSTLQQYYDDEDSLSAGESDEEEEEEDVVEFRSDFARHDVRRKGKRWREGGRRR